MKVETTVDVEGLRITTLEAASSGRLADDLLITVFGGKEPFVRVATFDPAENSLFEDGVASSARAVALTRGYLRRIPDAMTALFTANRELYDPARTRFANPMTTVAWADVRLSSDGQQVSLIQAGRCADGDVLVVRNGGAELLLPGDMLSSHGRTAWTQYNDRWDKNVPRRRSEIWYAQEILLDHEGWWDNSAIGNTPAPRPQHVTPWPALDVDEVVVSTDGLEFGEVLKRRVPGFSVEEHVSTILTREPPAGHPYPHGDLAVAFIKVAAGGQPVKEREDSSGVTEIVPALAHGFERIAIIGVGLVGGSIGYAAARNNIEVHAWDPDPASAALAAALGWKVHPTMSEAVEGVDLVVLAGPVGTLVEDASLVADKVSPGAIVTDVGSVKGEVSEGLRAVFEGSDVFVVPGHPMAGKASSGLMSADPNLFEGATWLFTSEPESEETRRMATFVRSLGAIRVASVDAETHDVLVALISHTPQLVASALAAGVGEASRYRTALGLAGGGFRDTTRIAASPWTMWGPIVETNREAILPPLIEVRDRLDAIIKSLLACDYPDVEKVFIEANNARGIYDDPDWSGTVPFDREKWKETAMREGNGANAWTDKSLGWTTIRTVATNPYDHALLAYEFLAEKAGVVFDEALMHREKDTTPQIAELVGGEYSTTWTADGVYVRGVILDHVFYVIP